MALQRCTPCVVPACHVLLCHLAALNLVCTPVGSVTYSGEAGLMAAADVFCARAIGSGASPFMAGDAAASANQLMSYTPPSPPAPPAPPGRRPPRLAKTPLPPAPVADYEVGEGLRVQAQQAAEDAAFFAKLYAVSRQGGTRRGLQPTCCTAPCLMAVVHVKDGLLIYSAVFAGVGAWRAWLTLHPGPMLCSLW